MDGHSSHYCPDTIYLAAKEGVILFALPPNTTHLAQPLDKGVFGPFKIHWRQVCHDFRVSNPGKSITIYNFSRLLSKTWMESMTPVNITAGFRTTGIFPLDPDAVIKKIPGKATSTTNYSDTPPLFTPLKRQAKPLKVLATPILHDGDSGENSLLSSPLVSDFPDNSLDQQPALQNILTLKTPEFKVKDLKIDPDSEKRVLTSKEFVKQLQEKQQTREKKRKEKQERKNRAVQKAPSRKCAGECSVHWYLQVCMHVASGSQGKHRS